LSNRAVFAQMQGSVKTFYTLEFSTQKMRLI
jgi:hypothetical protein